MLLFTGVKIAEKKSEQIYNFHKNASDYYLYQLWGPLAKFSQTLPLVWTFQPTFDIFAQFWLKSFTFSKIWIYMRLHMF